MLDGVFWFVAGIVLGIILGFLLSIARCELCKRGFVKSIDDLQNRLINQVR